MQKTWTSSRRAGAHGQHHARALTLLTRIIAERGGNMSGLNADPST